MCASAWLHYVAIAMSVVIGANRKLTSVWPTHACVVAWAWEGWAQCMRGCMHIGLALRWEVQLGRHLPLELERCGFGRGPFLAVVFFCESLGRFACVMRTTKRSEVSFVF